MKKPFTPVHGRSKLPMLNSWWRCSGAVFLFCFSIANLATAQTKIWDKTYGGFDQDELRSIQPTSDGGYILGGTSHSEAGGDKTEGRKGEYDIANYWIVKLKADGTKAWDKTIGGRDRDDLTLVQQTADGGYILGGTSQSRKSADKSEGNQGPLYTNDYWIVKLNKDGQKVWDNTFGGNHNDRLNSLQQTADGGYILGGYSVSSKSGDRSSSNKGESDYWVVKLNTDGTKAWDVSIGGSGSDMLAKIQQTADGGYILGGSTSSKKSGDKTTDAPGGWLVKLKADGTKVWEKIVGNSISALQQTTDGGYIVGSYTSSKQTLSDYLVVKLKADGTQVWKKIVGGNKYESLSSLQQTNDGGYLLGGSSNSDASGDKRERNQGASSYSDGTSVSDYWIVKLKPNGTKEWDKTIGSNLDDLLVNAFQTSDGNYILGGTSNSERTGDKSQGNKGESDYWVVKLDNNINTGKEQFITFKNILNQDVANSPVTLQATATSGLPVSFSVVSGPATVKNNQLTLTGIGTVTVKAKQGGNATYDAAREVIQSFQVINSPVTQVWNKTFGGVASPRPPEYEGLECMDIGRSTFKAMIALPDGGYLLAGSSDSKKGNDKSEDYRGAAQECYTERILDYWVVKTDSNGKRVWDKTYGGDNQDNLTTLIATTDGGIVLGGYSKSNVSGDNTAGPGFWLVKIDAHGNKLWDKSVKVTQQDYSISLNPQLIATTDGGFLLTNSQKSVVKINSKGDQVWKKTFSTIIGTFLATSDGGFLMGRTFGATDPNSSDSEDHNYLILKSDSNGNTIWEKTYGGPDHDYLSTIIAAPGGGYLLGGSSRSGIGEDKTEGNKGRPDVNGNATYDYWLVKIDASGTKLWDKTIGGNDYDNLVTIVTTADGGYLLGGNSRSDISGDKSEANRGTKLGNAHYTEDYWVVKLDGAGQKLWDKTFGGNGNEEEFKALIANPDNTYLLGGTTNSPVGGDRIEALKGLTDYWVIKIKDKNPLVTINWNMRYGGSGSDQFTSVIKTTDGGYLSGGYTNSGVSGDKTQTSQGKNDYWIVKSDKNGKKEWDKRYGGSGDDFLNSVIQTADGGYLLAGSSLSGSSGDKTEVSRGDRDYWVVKVDAQGNKEWDKRFGGSGYDELKKAVQLPSGRYVLAGTSRSPQSGDKSQDSQGGTDYWVLKISSEGKKVWDRRFGGNFQELLGDLLLFPDGSMLVGGSSNSGINGDKTQASRGSSDYWVVRLDGNGQKIWDKRFGGSGEDQLVALASTNSNTGNLFIAGTSSSDLSGDKSQASQGGTDYWMIKINSNGSKIWDKRFGGNMNEELRSIIMTEDGGYLLAGSSASGISGNKMQLSQGGNDYWLVKTNSLGVLAWEKRWGGNDEEELRAILPTSEGGYLLGGRSASGVSGDRTQPSQGGTDYWLLKVGPETTPIVATRQATNLEEPLVPALIPFQAYPNPFQEQITVSFTLLETQTATVKVRDSQGQEIATLFQAEAQANQTYWVEWQAGNQAAGMYFLQLQTPTGQSTQKLLLAK